MLGALIPVIAVEVKASLVKKKKTPLWLARKAKVGAHFTHSLRSVTPENWRKTKFQKQLLQVLGALDLRYRLVQVLELIKKGRMRAKNTRLKFDRRAGGKIYSRRS